MRFPLSWNQQNQGEEPGESDEWLSKSKWPCARAKWKNRDQYQIFHLSNCAWFRVTVTFSHVWNSQKGCMLLGSKDMPVSLLSPILHLAYHLVPRSFWVHTGWRTVAWRCFYAGVLTVATSTANHSLTLPEGTRACAALVPAPYWSLQVALLFSERQIPDRLFSYHLAFLTPKNVHVCVCSHTHAHPCLSINCT